MLDPLFGFTPEPVVIKETSKKAPEFKPQHIQEAERDSVFNMSSIIEEVLREHAKFLEKLLADLGLTIDEFNEKFYLEEHPEESEMLFDHEQNAYGIRYSTRYQIKLKGKHSNGR